MFLCCCFASKLVRIRLFSSLDPLQVANIKHVIGKKQVGREDEIEFVFVICGLYSVIVLEKNHRNLNWHS